MHPKRREERSKPFATFLSNLGLAVLVAGFVAPLVSGRVDPLVIPIAFVSAFALHLLAQAVLHYVVRDEPEEDL